MGLSLKNRGVKLSRILVNKKKENDTVKIQLVNEKNENTFIPLAIRSPPVASWSAFPHAQSA